MGASAEIVTEILKRAGYTAKITLLPWKRCLFEVEEGRMAMLLDASYNEERAQKYLISKPLYSLHSALYYMRSRYQSPPKLSSVDDMKQYKYCGLFGYNYTMYALPETQLDTAATSEVVRFKMLRGGRCDFVLGDTELLRAFAAMGQLDLDGTDYIPIPDAKPKEFHIMATKKTAEGSKLVKLIDDGIAAMKKDKSYDGIFRKHGM